MTVAELPAGASAGADTADTSPNSAADTSTDSSADARLRWHPGGPYDLLQSLGPLRRGHGDPSIRVTPDGQIWMAFTTPAGPATLRLVSAGPPSGPWVEASAWGSGAAEAAASVPRLLGRDDDWTAFDEPAFHATLPAMVADARRRNRALRLPATGRMIDSLVPTVLEQKVTVMEARRGYRYLMYRFGTAAPGAGTVAPANLLIQPTPQQWLRIPSWEWHKAGVGPQRSATVMRALRSAVALERLAELPAAEAAARLQTIPGIGVWTAAEVVQRTHGCPDSIAVGDYHLAAYVGAALTGRRTDDAGMLRLLAPWAGHRQRVVRLIGLSGFRKPVFGPRMTIQDHRRH